MSRQMNRITVMIVDKLAFFRAGLREVLGEQTEFEVIDCHPDEDILEIIETKTPDVLLLDVDYPSLSGLELSRKILRHHPGTRVVMLSSNPDDEQLFEVTKTGAVAYLDKNSTAEKLAEIIIRAHNGEYPINESLVATPRVAEHVLRQFQSMASMERIAEGVVARLTPRETQILNYIADGNSNKQIAHTLEISEQTIKNHVSAILRKLNANDRAHAVALAMRHGWISLEEELASPSNR
jgi:two-component system response regulator DegU